MANKVGAIEFDVDVDSSGLVSGNAKIVQSNEAVEQSFRDIDKTAATSTKNVAAGAQKATGSFRTMKGATTQLGYQMQDIAIQAQMGTSAFVILGQQGSQIASLFGPGGALFGAVLAISAAIGGTLVTALNQTKEEMNALPDALQKRLDDIKKRYGEIGESTKAAFQEVEMAKLNAEYDKHSKELAKIDKLIASIPYDQAGNNARQFWRNQRDDVESTRNDIQKLIDQVSDAFTSGLASDTGSVIYTPEQQKQAQAEIQNRLTLLQDAMNLEGNIIANSNKRLFEIEMGAKSEREALLDEQTSNRIAKLNSQYAQESQLLEQERIAALENKVMTAEQKAELDAQYNALALQAKEQHENELTNVERDASDARKKIAEAESKQKMAIASSIFGNLSQLMNTESRKMFEVGKAAALAGAIVDGIAAVQGAYKAGAKIGGPPLGAAYAATSAIATLANIQQIKSTKFGSANAAGGQSYSGGVVANNVAQQSSRQDISISVTGGDDAGRALMDIIRFQVQNGNSLPVGG